MNVHRRSKEERRDKRKAFIWAVLIHAVIVVVLVFSVTNRTEPMNMMFAEKVDVVKATVRTEDDLKKSREAKKKLEEQIKLEEKRRKEEERKKLEEKRKLEEKKKAEEKKKREAEAERKRIELQKKKEQERKLEEKKKAEEKKKREAEAERKRIEKKKKDEERRKKELAQKKAAEKEKQRLEQERKDAFAKQLAAEEARIAEERAITLKQKYYALIGRTIRYYWQYPPGLPSNLVARVKVRVSFKGDVQDVSFVKRSGNPIFDREVEKTIYKASPLPIPTVEEDKDLNKDFQNIPLKFDINL